MSRCDLSRPPAGFSRRTRSARRCVPRISTSRRPASSVSRTLTTATAARVAPRRRSAPSPTSPTAHRSRCTSTGLGSSTRRSPSSAPPASSPVTSTPSRSACPKGLPPRSARDVWEEDPTVKRLEALAAERLGKAAGLFVASGTMGHLVSVVSHTRTGQEVILDLDSHIFNYEVAGAAVIGNVQMRPVKTARGFLTPDQVREALRPANIHIPQSGLVCVENTHNRHGGTCCTPEEISAIADIAHGASVPVHLDGARLFNAAVALKRPAREFTRDVDSVTFCVSKGLAAPVGSVICGSAEFTARARRVRKMLGGGMRQAGIIAAAGIVALERMVDRLAEDHVNARTLAEGLARLPRIAVD